VNRRASHRLLGDVHLDRRRLGIDYGIYVLFRWDEEVMLGSGRAALDLMATRTGPGILLALSAAATFYVLTVTDFHGVQELGFIAGTALITSFVAMLTVFPALLVSSLGARRPRPPSPIDHAGARDRAGGPFVEFLSGTDRRAGRYGILTALLALVHANDRFDYNLCTFKRTAPRPWCGTPHHRHAESVRASPGCPARHPWRARA